MQVILVLETRSAAKTDYTYVKTAFDYFYGVRIATLNKIFAKSKGELIKQDKNIAIAKKKYDGKSIVVIVADYDRADDPLNGKITSYCKNKGYELLWMNIDVEEVFLGTQVPDKLKVKESTEFLTKKNTYLSKNNNLDCLDPLKKHPSSNFLNIFDKYFKRIT